MNRLAKWIAGIAVLFCALFLGTTQIVLPGSCSVCYYLLRFRFLRGHPGQTTGWSVSVRFTEGFVRNYIRTNLFFIKLFVIMFAEFSLISISLKMFS